MTFCITFTNIIDFLTYYSSSSIHTLFVCCTMKQSILDIISRYSLTMFVSRSTTLSTITSIAFAGSSNYITCHCISLIFLLFTTSSLYKQLISAISFLISFFLTTFLFQNSSCSRCNIMIFVANHLHYNLQHYYPSWMIWWTIHKSNYLSYSGSLLSYASCVDALLSYLSCLDVLPSCSFSCVWHRATCYQQQHMFLFNIFCKKVGRLFPLVFRLIISCIVFDPTIMDILVWVALFCKMAIFSKLKALNIWVTHLTCSPLTSSSSMLILLVGLLFFLHLDRDICLHNHYFYVLSLIL